MQKYREISEENNSEFGDALPLDARHGIAEAGRLYGMCYLLEERSTASLDVAAEVALMKNLGVQTVRHWMHFSHFMQGPSQLGKDREQTKNMHAMLAACAAAGMVNIGMNHHNFCTTRRKATSSCKPFARNISAGSEYVQWLNDYYTSWKTLVSEFPEVEYWEIDNEVNNTDFMNDGVRGANTYDTRMMAAIAADMFYYGTRGIHDGNPKAKSVMGGLTEPTGLGNGNTAEFLQYLYDNIASGEYGYFYGKEPETAASKNPDDYFEIACWHPYMHNFDPKLFVEINNSYYETVLRNEKKHKRVFFTEIGWNDMQMGGEETANRYFEEMFKAIKREMPYVETVNVFKLYDNGTLNNWDGPNFLYYGFFHDPDPTHVYDRLVTSPHAINIDGAGNCMTGAPKNKAYAFQRLAGGEGDLNLLLK